MAETRSKYSGPIDHLGPTMAELAPGVRVTSGRAVVVEGGRELCLIDPGDEPMALPRALTLTAPKGQGRPGRLSGPLSSSC